jgi:hypothetical protein
MQFKKKKHCYHCCEAYPIYSFSSTNRFYSHQQSMCFKVSIIRGFDSTIMIDLLVGERLTLMPLSLNKKLRDNEKQDDYILCKIMTIDQSGNGRRCFITVETL